MGYSPFEWEFDREETYWVTVGVPPEKFDEIVTAVRSGRVERLRVGLGLSMWTKQKSNGFMPEEDMEFRPTDG